MRKLAESRCHTTVGAQIQGSFPRLGSEFWSGPSEVLFLSGPQAASSAEFQEEGGEKNNDKCGVRNQGHCWSGIFHISLQFSLWQRSCTMSAVWTVVYQMNQMIEFLGAHQRLSPFCLTTACALWCCCVSQHLALVICLATVRCLVRVVDQKVMPSQPTNRNPSAGSYNLVHGKYSMLKCARTHIIKQYIVHH